MSFVNRRLASSKAAICCVVLLHLIIKSSDCQATGKCSKTQEILLQSNHHTSTTTILSHTQMATNSSRLITRTSVASAAPNLNRQSLLNRSSDRWRPQRQRLSQLSSVQSHTTTSAAASNRATRMRENQTG